MAALQGLAPSPRLLSRHFFEIDLCGYPPRLSRRARSAGRSLRTRATPHGNAGPLAMQDALAEFIDPGAYLAHIRKMKRLYKDGATACCRRLPLRPAAASTSKLRRVACICSPAPRSIDDQRAVARLLRPASSAAPYQACFTQERRSGPVSRLYRWNGGEIDQAPHHRAGGKVRLSQARRQRSNQFHP